MLFHIEPHFPYEKYECYFTFSYVVIDPKNACANLAVAGHPAPYFIHSNEVHKVEVVGPILGLELEGKWENKKIILNKNDKIIIVSDGVLELANTQGRFDMSINSFITKFVDCSADKLVNGLRDQINNFVKDSEIKDDLTIICVENK